MDFEYHYFWIIIFALLNHKFLELKLIVVFKIFYLWILFIIPHIPIHHLIFFFLLFLVLGVYLGIVILQYTFYCTFWLGIYKWTYIYNFSLHMWAYLQGHVWYKKEHFGKKMDLCSFLNDLFSFIILFIYNMDMLGQLPLPCPS